MIPAEKKYFSVGLVLVLALCGLQRSAYGQKNDSEVFVILAPGYAVGNFGAGKKVNFEVEVYNYGYPVRDCKKDFKIGPEKMDPIQLSTRLIKQWLKKGGGE